MATELSRSSISRPNDPHDWNSYDHYTNIHEKRLSEHPFVESNTLVFREIEDEGVLFVHIEGDVYCSNGAVLTVEKWLETSHAGARMMVRGAMYRYIGYLRGGTLALKYHNLHEDPNDYIHRVYDLDTGTEVITEHLSRHQFPTFTEVLDELEVIVSQWLQGGESSEGTSKFPQ